jgi:hypothetical protein
MFEGQAVSQESAVRTARPTWDEIDRRLRGIAARRAGLDLEEARWLLVARREELHRHLGYARLEEYMERVLGYGPHAAAERLRVADALVELPETRAAIEAGELHYSAVRELTRVMIPETESAWLDAARGRSLREIEPMVAGRKKSDLPGGPADPKLLRHVVRFEVSGETLALLRDARMALADTTGEQIDDNLLLATLCRAVLEGGEAAEPTRARAQIALTLCEGCGRGWQDGGGTPIEVDAAAIERAQCDAQHIGRLDADVPARATQDIPPSVARLVWRRDHGRCVVPGCRSARFLDLHHIVFRCHGGDHTADNLCLICDAHHKAVHDGDLIIRGRASSDLVFAHSDGRPYGAPPPAPTRTSILEDAIAAVRSTGFSAAEARGAVAAVASHVGVNAPVEDLVRAAFQQLRPVPTRTA